MCQPARETVPTERSEMTGPLPLSNQFLQALLENLQVGIVACDANGVLTLFNRATRQFHGLPLEPVPADRWAEHYHLFEADGSTPMTMDRVPLFRALRGEKVEEAIMVIAPTNAPARTLLASGQAFHDAEGTLLGALVSMHDITERALAQAALSQANKELEARVALRTAELTESNAALAESDRRKSEFLAMLAHELRNPLAPLSYAVDMLASPRGEAANTDHVVSVMRRQLAQLIRLVDELLDISRISRGKVELRVEPVELGALIECAVEMSRPAIESASHALVLDMPSARIFFDADPVRLAQVLSNLLNNAAKYTPAGGRITLAASADEGQVRIAVEDDGIGIAKEDLDAIFEVFVQLDRSPERVTGGLGIGLTLVRRLVELHGGQVSAGSAGPGKGSRFELVLPRRHAHMRVSNQAGPPE